MHLRLHFSSTNRSYYNLMLDKLQHCSVRLHNLALVCSLSVLSRRFPLLRRFHVQAACLQLLFAVASFIVTLCFCPAYCILTGAIGQKDVCAKKFDKKHYWQCDGFVAVTLRTIVCNDYDVFKQIQPGLSSAGNPLAAVECRDVFPDRQPLGDPSLVLSASQ